MDNINLDLQSQMLPNSEFEVCPRETSLSVQARISKFKPEVQTTWLRSLLFWGTINIYCFASRSWMFHSLNPLHVYWSSQPRVIRRLTLLLWSISRALFLCEVWSEAQSVLVILRSITTWYCLSSICLLYFEEICRTILVLDCNEYLYQPNWRFRYFQYKDVVLPV